MTARYRVSQCRVTRRWQVECTRNNEVVAYTPNHRAALMLVRRLLEGRSGGR